MQDVREARNLRTSREPKVGAVEIWTLPREGLFGLVGVTFANSEFDAARTFVGGVPPCFTAWGFARFGEPYRLDGLTSRDLMAKVVFLQRCDAPTRKPIAPCETHAASKGN